jgi:DMSO reductase anchor subunit
MIFEYLQLTGTSGSWLSLDFISRVLFLIIAGLILALVGYKIKGIWGAALALAAGVVLVFYNEGIIRFR